MKLFDIFKRKRPVAIKTKAQPYDLTTWYYSNFGKDALAMDVVASCIDALARNQAKMRLRHLIRGENQKIASKESGNIQRVLDAPNDYMTGYDFRYKITALYYLTNNVFILKEYNSEGILIALHPINYKYFKIYEHKGNLYAKFVIKYTREYTVPYEDLIHLRNKFINDDILGETNDALIPACELINSQNQGIINGIKNSAIIRGLLKSSGVIKENDLKKYKEQFIKDNLSASNNGGVIVMDSKFEYKPLDTQNYTIDSKLMETANDKVFSFFGVNQDFIQNKFKSDAYNAVYEGRLEPFAIMIAEAFTHKLFTKKERGHGNVIEVEMNRLHYQSIDKITYLFNVTNQIGLFTINEMRQMLGYSPVEDGDKRIVSLNYINAEKQDEYQGGKKDE